MELRFALDDVNQPTRRSTQPGRPAYLAWGLQCACGLRASLFVTRHVATRGLGLVGKCELLTAHRQLLRTLLLATLCCRAGTRRLALQARNVGIVQGRPVLDTTVASDREGVQGCATQVKILMPCRPRTRPPTGGSAHTALIVSSTLP